MKIAFRSQGAIPIENTDENQRRNRLLGIPRVEQSGNVASRLAVVGGSPDVIYRVDELRSWDGEVWAINGTYDWCISNGIDATFYSIDPCPIISSFSANVTRAIVADTVDWSVMENLTGKQVEIAFLGDGGLPFGTTAACTSVSIAAARGHKSVTFFGCASSFIGGLTHAYRDEGDVHGHLELECGGKRYFSRPDLIVQAEAIAEIAQSMPEFVNVRGGGFLPALMKHGDYDIVGMDSTTLKNLYEQNPHLAA